MSLKQRALPPNCGYCSLCEKPIEYSKAHKHWSASKGHKTPERPDLPSELRRPVTGSRVGLTALDVDDDEVAPTMEPRHEESLETEMDMEVNTAAGIEMDMELGMEVDTRIDSGRSDIAEDEENENILTFPNAGKLIQYVADYYVGLPSESGQRIPHPKVEAREAMRQDRQKNLWHPYVSLEQYQLVRDHARPKIQPEKQIQSVCVNSKHTYLKDSDAPFASVKQFMSCLDKISDCQSNWQEVQINREEQTANMSWDSTIRYWKRDTVAVLQEIFENPLLDGKCVWGPIKDHNSVADRVYTDLHTGDWWWKQQVAPFN